MFAAARCASDMMEIIGLRAARYGAAGTTATGRSSTGSA
jgi:hypothetical protein